MAKVLDIIVEVRGLALELHNCVHFRIDIIGKGMKPLIPPSYMLNSITPFLLQKLFYAKAILVDQQWYYL